MNCAIRNRILLGDVRERLADLPPASIDCVITSPPYYQLRDYGIGAQLGLERHVDEWVDALGLTFNGLVRVLKPTGSLWLNLGDTYSRHESYGASAKSLLLGPERLLLALAHDGWIVRNKVVWAKTNPMPHSVSDRLSNSYEVVYFLTRSQSYWFDLDAIRLPHRSHTPHGNHVGYPPARAGAPLWRQRQAGNRGLAAQRARGEVGHPLGKNPGDVWPLGSASFHGGHFATFPPALVERPLLAACPELVCDSCGTPFRRPTQRRRGRRRPERREPRRKSNNPGPGRGSASERHVRPPLPSCTCAATASAGIVLDPFFGAGTVGLVAERHGRDWVGIELNPAYVEIAERRLREDRARRRADGPAVDGSYTLASAEQPSHPERGEEP